MQSMACILVELHPRQGLFDLISLMVGDRSYAQVLDYVNIPFRCARCQKVGHCMTDCELNFMNKYMGKGVEVPRIRVTTLTDPQLMKASLTTPTFRRDKTIEYL